MQPVIALRVPKRGRYRGRRGVAALEFGLAAPILLTLIWGSYDVSRALVAWEETYHAAEAIAQAAEKMSVTGSNNAVTGAPILALTSQRMQDAMTTIYAEMPFLNLGGNSGSFGGQFSVTLSGVTYLPPCQANAHGPSACVLPQTPQVIWSAYLTQGGAQLLTPPTTPAAMLLRPCGAPGVIGGSFPNNGNQLATLVDANKAGAGGTSINMLPQVVADVRYVFTPTFPLLRQNFTFWASASFPAPLGGDDQPIVFDLTHSLGSVAAVLSCLASSVYGGPV
jgi:Flp pilus assembly protein TadG